MSAETVAFMPLLRSTMRLAPMFHNPYVAVALGIVLPLICLLLDPIVFRSCFGEAILRRYKPGVASPRGR